jgi:hypothetical protein
MNTGHHRVWQCKVVYHLAINQQSELSGIEGGSPHQSSGQAEINIHSSIAIESPEMEQLAG